MLRARMSQDTVLIGGVKVSFETVAVLQCADRDLLLRRLREIPLAELRLLAQLVMPEAPADLLRGQAAEVVYNHVSSRWGWSVSAARYSAGRESWRDAGRPFKVRKRRLAAEPHFGREKYSLVWEWEEVPVTWAEREKLHELVAESLAKTGQPVMEGRRWLGAVVERWCPAFETIHGPEAPMHGAALLHEYLPKDVRIVRASVPCVGKTEEEKKRLAVLMDHFAERVFDPRVVFAGVENGSLTLVETDTPMGWLGFIEAAGIEFAVGGKLAKRLKALTRPFTFAASFEAGSVEVIEVEGEEALYDGALFITERLFYETMDRTPRESIALVDTGAYLGADASVPPMSFRMLDGEGMTKGVAHVVPESRMPQWMRDRLPEHGLAVFTHRCNVKREVRSVKRTFVGMTPMPMHRKARTSLQFIINLPSVFTEERLLDWLSQDLRRAARRALDNLAVLEQDPPTREEEREGVSASHHHRMREIQGRYLDAGGKITESHFLVSELFATNARRYIDHERGRINVPIPRAWDMQIVSESAARCMGYLGVVTPGRVRTWCAAHVAVVSDVDWAEMLPSHGGCDQDDHFVLVWFGNRVLVLRTPNDLGEYSVFSAHPDDECPAPAARLDGKFREEPAKEETLDESTLPARVSDRLRTGALRYEERPAKRPWLLEGSAYDKDHVMNLIRQSTRNLQPGSVINLFMLRNLVLGEEATLFCSLEDAVDGCVQSSQPEFQARLSEYAEGILGRVSAAGLPVPKWFHEAKLKNHELPPLQIVEDDWLTALAENITALLDRMKAWVDKTIEAKRGVSPFGDPGAGHPTERVRSRYMTLLAQTVRDLETFGDIPKTARSEMATSACRLLQRVTRAAVGKATRAFAGRVYHADVPARDGTDALLPNRDNVLFSEPFFEDYLQDLMVVSFPEWEDFPETGDDPTP